MKRDSCQLGLDLSLPSLYQLALCEDFENLYARMCMRNRRLGDSTSAAHLPATKVVVELFRILMVVIEARYIPNICSVVTHLESPREAFVRRQSDVAC